MVISIPSDITVSLFLSCCAFLLYRGFVFNDCQYKSELLNKPNVI